MLDTVSLRVAMAVVALTMLVSFYLATYRPTRAPFCGWWCVSLGLMVLGSGAYILDGTSVQAVSQPVANMMVVSGTVAAWIAAASLRRRRPPWWQIGAAPVAVGIASVLDQPATNTWSGGPVYLASMALLTGAAAWELWRTQIHDAQDDGTARMWHRTLAAASGLFSLFTALRWVVFVTAGPDSAVFDGAFGTESATLVILVMLVATSAGMSSLSVEQQARSLRYRATHDGLTGALNRAEFLRRADEEIRHARGGTRGAAVVLADLDHFKIVNDTYGHRAGDLALRAFTECCLAELRAGDLVGRVGGEEFALLLPGCDPARARVVAEAIGERFRGYGRRMGRPMSASFGVAAAHSGSDTVDSVVERADRALYEAKAAGRDRTVLDRS